MIHELRNKFNGRFSEEKYRDYLQQIENMHPGSLDFRVAETPVFVSASFKNKMLDTCDEILDSIYNPEYKEISERSIPEQYRMNGESSIPEMLIFDFGVCEDSTGSLSPQLIELQGFPSLFAYQMMSEKYTRSYAEIPPGYSSYLNGFDEISYSKLIQDLIVGDENPEEVVLMEVMPEQQKTRIDFFCTQQLLGITILCISQVFAEGSYLYYYKDERKIRIKRIFNRVIFDDLEQQPITPGFDIKGDYEVKWIPHPNWFYRISKFTLPFLHHPYIPETYFLNELKIPVDLSNYVLKPLFSFAGQGVIIDIQPEDLERIEDPENWIIQKKVTYASVIETPDEAAKAEIRLFYFKHPDWPKHLPVHNLARLSKGKMIGTRYNKDKTWVGGSIAYFEQ